MLCNNPFCPDRRGSCHADPAGAGTIAFFPRGSDEHLVSTHDDRAGQAIFGGVRDIDLHLDIRLTEIGDDYLRGTMPVDERTRQPFGLLHGGANVVLAETLGSIASNFASIPASSMPLGRRSAQITSVRRVPGG